MKEKEEEEESVLIHYQSKFSFVPDQMYLLKTYYYGIKHKIQAGLGGFAPGVLECTNLYAGKDEI